MAYGLACKSKSFSARIVNDRYVQMVVSLLDFSEFRGLPA